MHVMENKFIPIWSSNESIPPLWKSLVLGGYTEVSYKVKENKIWEQRPTWKVSLSSLKNFKTNTNLYLYMKDILVERIEKQNPKVAIVCSCQSQKQPYTVMFPACQLKQIISPYINIIQQRGRATGRLYCLPWKKTQKIVYLVIYMIH